MAKPLSLNKLEKIWYKKLKDFGFDDIELNGYLKDWSNRDVVHDLYSHIPMLGGNSNRLIKITSKRDYYIFAEHYIVEGEFCSKDHKTIWTMHANGVGIVDITKTLNKGRKGKRTTYKRKVHETIQAIRKQMFFFYNIGV